MFTETVTWKMSSDYPESVPYCIRSHLEVWGLAWEGNNGPVWQKHVSQRFHFQHETDLLNQSPATGGRLMGQLTSRGDLQPLAKSHCLSGFLLLKKRRACWGASQTLSCPGFSHSLLEREFLLSNIPVCCKWKSKCMTFQMFVSVKRTDAYKHFFFCRKK